MQTVGFIGIGKIGVPISANLIKSGYRVVGYRRSSLAEFEKLGGVPHVRPLKSARKRTSSYLPSDELSGSRARPRKGGVHQARPGQIVVESVSIRFPSRRSGWRRSRERRLLIDGEVAGTPGMVLARKGVVFAGDAAACKKLEPVVAGFADTSRWRMFFFVFFLCCCAYLR